jgi:PadR family transcriptional regulator PadR
VLAPDRTASHQVNPANVLPAPHHQLMGLACRTPDDIQSHHYLMGLTNTASDLLPGTLELLILKSLGSGPKHGYAIVEHLRVTSRDILHVGESALYPALQRLLLNGWAKAEWGLSETNRRARYYRLTAAGRKQLVGERAEFERMVQAVQYVLDAT